MNSVFTNDRHLDYSSIVVIAVILRYMFVLPSIFSFGIVPKGRLLSGGSVVVISQGWILSSCLFQRGGIGHERIQLTFGFLLS